VAGFDIYALLDRDFDLEKRVTPCRRFGVGRRSRFALWHASSWCSSSRSGGGGLGVVYYLGVCVVAGCFSTSSR
jgi:hypothetical protein